MRHGPARGAAEDPDSARHGVPPDKGGWGNLPVEKVDRQALADVVNKMTVLVSGVATRQELLGTNLRQEPQWIVKSGVVRGRTGIRYMEGAKTRGGCMVPYRSGP